MPHFSEEDDDDEESVIPRRGTLKTYQSHAIVRNIASYKKNPIRGISPDALEILWAIRLELSNSVNACFDGLLRLLDCYLCITGHCLTSKVFTADVNGLMQLRKIFYGFAAALYSERFIDAVPNVRHRYACAWRIVVDKIIGGRIDSEKFFISLKRWEPTEQMQLLVAQFDSLIFDDEEVQIWRGWPVKNLKDAITWPNLFPIYRRFGRQFTEKLHLALDSFFSRQNSDGLDGFSTLVSFLSELPSSITYKDFQNPHFMSRMWRDFIVYFVTVEAKAATYNSIYTKWGRLRILVENYLCGADIFATTRVKFPELPEKEASGVQSHRRKDKDGEVIIVKLLIDVPLKFTDEEALNILFVQIKEGIDVVTQWAEHEVKNIWRNYQARKTLAKIGTVRTVPAGRWQVGEKKILHRDSTNFRADAAATFEHYGFSLITDKTDEGFYPRPLGDLAEQLGLPTKRALLPHMALLVIEHPELTQSFFTELELYNKNGKITGVVQANGGWVLRGNKMRKGKRLAQQEIFLTPRTNEIIQQIIHLTEPLRKYLKKQGDKKWRRLFLTCGGGFNYPIVQNMSDMSSSDTSYRILLDQFQRTSRMDLAHLGLLVERFSLATLRATVAVASYIDDPDVAKLAKKLGHNEFNPKLMERYLPAPLMAFFQERWVRLFQCAILVEALKGSPYVLFATGFENMEELHIFLKNHALKTIPREKVHDDSKVRAASSVVGFDQVIYGVSVENLTVLISLVGAVKAATRPVRDLAIYWSKHGEALLEYIRNCQPPREDLQAYLKEAQMLARPSMVEEMIYA